MTREAPRFERYRWAGGEEWMLRFGPAGGPQVIAALPLFEEANRTRALVVTILRMLAARGIGGALPDLPGQGESLVPTTQMRLAALRQALVAADNHISAPAQPGAQSDAPEPGLPPAREHSRRIFRLAVRSGAILLADDGAPSWLLAPQHGGGTCRELVRLTAPDGSIAGNHVAPELLAELADAEPPSFGMRVVRLVGDPRAADRRIDAPPLWRRAEPDNDMLLAQVLGDDIADWIASCAG